MENENRMGTMPVNKLLLSMSLPIMISMLVQALYNVVDSIFVAQISENALTAVSMAFPAQNLMIAISVGTAVGINSLLARNLGEKDFEGANRAAKNGLFLSLVSFIGFAILGAFLSRPFFELQMGAAPVAEIIDNGTTYMVICSIFSFGLFFQVTFERLLQSTGKSLLSMWSQLAGAVVNIALDPIFIFGLLGMPKMGVAGAAIATVAGQIVAAVFGLILNLKKNPEINISFKGFRPHGSTIRKIYAVGLPSIVMSSISSVMTYGMNIILNAYTSTATAVFGVYFKLQSFIFMPIFGLNNGMVPIIAYNYGACHRERIIKTIKLGCIYAVALMLVGLALFWSIPEALLYMFEASPEMIAIGVPALRIISLSFIFAGFSVCTIAVTQALAHGTLALIISIVRQLVVLLPVAWLLTRLLGYEAVWWAFPIAEIACVILCVLFMQRMYNKTIRPIPLQAEQQAAME